MIYEDSNAACVAARERLSEAGEDRLIGVLNDVSNALEGVHADCDSLGHESADYELTVGYSQLMALNLLSIVGFVALFGGDDAK